MASSDYLICDECKCKIVYADHIDGVLCPKCVLSLIDRAEAAEAASEKTLAIFEDQRKRFGKCREERKAQKEINQIQSAAYQQQYDRLKAAEIRIRELEDPMCDQTDAVHALQAEVARLTLEIAEGK